MPSYLNLSQGTRKIGRYSFIGCDPYKVIRTGPEEEINGDPLIPIEKYLSDIKFIQVAGLPDFTGGAVGYIAFDCVRHFEPRTAREMKDPLGIPESIHMLIDTVVIVDHLYQKIKVVSHLRGQLGTEAVLQEEYRKAHQKISQVIAILLSPGEVKLPPQPPITQLGQKFTSNIGQEGYEGHVRAVQDNIKRGEVIQAVPSQRLSRPTCLHPFNVYRYLRTVNPAPYLFYLDLDEFQAVGASPEMLVKVGLDRKVYTHPIAGTRRRGATSEEDMALELDLKADIKETAEHVMLVDLGRNDLNRVCNPVSVKVDSLMHIERYSHVMHLVSNVSGTLREGKTRFDAFRSVFPAGTVSGAPKVRALELIAELEGERRGIYAGSVGSFDYSGGLNTCIAIRTMTFKDGIAYLQAGGGIVADSVPLDEYHETLAKLRSNVTTLDRAEEYYARLQGL
ncbi:anthranilate synthase component 1 [Entomophthora muscae]|uniref:Anthranilate synthase component 1 n=1 Tax=Entomophthora muscae TaxID=34485 RepID=A0ACC2TNY6_9FUNG|nr:anthranilate synthase component 1 [Entomophthora muscae]